MEKPTKFKNVQKIFNIFEENGFEIFIVGGAVRDYLLGEEYEDIDFTTNATPDQIKDLFELTFDIGARYGTISVKVGDNFYEITTYRAEENYDDKRHPNQVKFATDLKSDVSRRDFTINSLAMTKDGKIIDYFDGLSDLREGLIRTVGEAADRFKEDELRKWRAIRFAAQKGFEFERNTFLALNYDPESVNVSLERIRDELNRIILSKKVNWGGYLLVRTRLYPLLLKRLNLNIVNRLDETEDLIESFEIMYMLSNDLITRLTALLFPMNYSEAELFLKQMKYSNTIIRQVLNLYQAMNVTKGATCF